MHATDGLAWLVGLLVGVVLFMWSPADAVVVQPARVAVEVAHPPASVGAGATSCERDVADLRGLIEAAEADLRLASFEGVLARGRTAAREGVQLPWVDGLPELVQADTFEQHLLEALDGVAAEEGVESVELLTNDCEEFPCVAVFLVEHAGALPGTGPAPGFPMAMEAAGYGELGSISNTSSVEVEHGALRLHTVAYYAKGPLERAGVAPRDVARRVAWRVTLLSEGFAAEVSP